jgi:RNA polymerase sigma factor (sigma-70 family)
MSTNTGRTQTSSRHTDVLNHLYDRYQLCPNDQQAAGDLFEEIRDFAMRVVSKECASKGWQSLRSNADDLVQTAVLNVWKGMKTFRSESKFSTWCYRIIQTTTIDAIRKPKGEVNFFPWKAYSPDYSGTAHADSAGTARDSGKRDDEFARENHDDADGHGFAARPLLAIEFGRQQENCLNANIDLRTKLNRLNPDDRLIALLSFVFGFPALEIAKKFGKNITRVGFKLSPGERWVQNRIAAIRKSINADGLSHAHNIGRPHLEQSNPASVESN